MGNLRPNRGRIPQLDGVRGIAVLLVMLAHMAGGVSPHGRRFIDGLSWDGGGGGLIGVQIFFVLSGYLITSILVSEARSTGSISLRGFYARRARRLVPALVVVCAVYAVYVAVAVDDVRGGLGDIVYALSYTANLAPIIRLRDTGWLGHTWSLAVEEQFYIVWPMVVLLTNRRPRRALATVSAAVILVTVVLRHSCGLFLGAHADYVRYNLLRWDALMLGCLLAVRPLHPPRVAGWAAGATILGLVIWLPNPIPAWMYTTSTLAAGVFLARSADSRWLTHPVLRHFGLVSYGLYLWHVLVLRLGLPGLVSLVLSVGFAEASHWLVERRFLTHGSRDADVRAIAAERRPSDRLDERHSTALPFD